MNEVWLALEATNVLEVRGHERFVAIPDSPPYLPGVIPWRSKAIAVIDLGVLLHLGESQDKDWPRTVITKLGAATCALPVDVVREVQEVPDADLRPPHATGVRFTQAEIELHGQMMPVLDLGAIARELTREVSRAH